MAAREIERKYDLSNKTAWFMLHRIREAMKRGPLADMMRGTVVADETFIGGSDRNKHKSQRVSPIIPGSGEQIVPGERAKRSRGPLDGKVPVLTLIDATTGEARSRSSPT